MTFTIAEIAAALGAQAVGDTRLTVTGAAEPAAAGADALAMAMSPAYAEGLVQGQARAAMLWQGADWQKWGLEAAILIERPRFAMSGLTGLMAVQPDIAPGIHPSAVIDPSAKIGAGAAIGPLVVVGRGVRIGARARIAAHSSIADDAIIGDDALILQGVRIGARVRIGDRFIGQPGAVIGGDGFSFVTPEKSHVEEVRETMGDSGAQAQPWVRIHSLGAVAIGDDVEVGSNSSIDRGTIRDTQIGDGTKIDSLVQVGHNVIVGRDCLLCAQAGVAGSAVVGDGCVLGGKSGVADNITLGARVVAGGGAIILSNVPEGRAVLGYPAMKMESHIESYKALRRLPRLMKQVAELQKSGFKSNEV
jgi:UDP-3-O-[3-hydroxymyristoyl] glucosamine N-acyltransferase